MATIEQLFKPLGVHEYIIDDFGSDHVSSIFEDAGKLAFAAVCVRADAIWSAIVEVLQTAYAAQEDYEKRTPKPNDKYYHSGRFAEPTQALAAIQSLAAYASGKTDGSELFPLCGKLEAESHMRVRFYWDNALEHFVEAAAQYSVNDIEYAQGQASLLIYQAIDFMHEGDAGHVFWMEWEDPDDCHKRTRYHAARYPMLEIIKKHLFPSQSKVYDFLRLAYSNNK